MSGAGIALLSFLITLSALELIGRVLITPLLVRYSNNQALKLQLARPRDLGVASLYVPHHYYLYGARPNYRSADGTLRHNAFGCRAEEVAIPKPRNIYRILAVGGSTTYGTGVRANAATFAYLLQRRFADWGGIDRPVEVLNCGVPGFTSAENLARYAFQLSDYQPDLLLIQQGLNDVLPRSLSAMSRDYREFSKPWEDLDPERETWFLMRLLKMARGLAQDSVWTQGINFLVRHPFWDSAKSGADGKNFARHSPRVFEANTRYLIRLAKSDGAQVLLLSEHLVVDPAERPTNWLPSGGVEAVLEHNHVLARLAEETGVLFLDLQAALCACGADMPDGRHLSEAGDAAKARVIFEYLRRENAAGRWTTT